MTDSSRRQAQVKSAAEGILALDALAQRATGAGTESQSSGGARVATNGPQPSISPGARLASLISQAEARFTIWSDDQLRAGAGFLRQGADRLMQDVRFYTDLRLMNIISHAIEDRVAEARLECELYAGFQRLALVKPQTLRYRALLESARFVYVYGIPDSTAAVERLSGEHRQLLTFPIDPHAGTDLEHFWFVVVDAPQFRTALLARHTGGDLWSSHQSGRTYAGIWTFDSALIDAIRKALQDGARSLYYGGTR